MRIILNKVKPSFMDLSEMGRSEVYLQDQCTFESGKTYQIKARSGSGKTSLLNFLFQYSTAFDGTIKWDIGEEWNRDVLRKYHLSYLFQDYKLFPELTAWENVQLKNQLTSHKTEQELHDYFQLLGIERHKDQLAGTLSLGQQQRVAAIRAISQPFELILLDEPFSHLDDENSKKVAQMIQQEAQQQQAGIIFTTLDEQHLLPYDFSFQL